MSRAKGNRFEREFFRQLVEADGSCTTFGVLASSTGRTGHLTELGVDGISQRFAGECKNRESLGDWLFDLVEQTAERANSYGKLPVVGLKKNRRSPVVALPLVTFLHLVRESNTVRPDRGLSVPSPHPEGS